MSFTHINEEEYKLYYADQVAQIEQLCHGLAREAGWWDNRDLDDPQTIPTCLCLVHSEVSEAMEGARKNRMDDHLPHRKAFEVELADAMIRILDLAGTASSRRILLAHRHDRVRAPAEVSFQEVMVQVAATYEPGDV